MKIRVATILDFEQCFSLGIQALRWLEPEKEIDEDHIRIQLYEFITKGVVIVSEVEEVITGIICGVIKENIWYPSERLLTELFWFVDPKYRESSAALRLLKAFINAGKNNNVDRVVMGIMAHSPINNNVYEKRGFKLLEQAFVLEV